MLKLMTKIEQKIPEGWSVKKLGECIHIFGGYAYSSDSIVESGIKWLKISNVGLGKLEYSHFDYLPLKYKTLTPEYILKKGDIVMALTRPILDNQLKVAYIDDEEYLLNQRVGKLILTKYIDKGFIFNKIISSEVVYKINSLLIGTDPPNLSSSVFNNINILLPPLPEQEKIAGILSCWDDGIEKLSALIEKKKIQKKAIMQQLLTGKHRLKGFSIPWHEVKLGNIGIISSAGVDKKIVEGEKLVNLLNYMDVYKKDFLYVSDASMTVSAPERQILNCNLKKGDIFFTPSSETRDDIAHSAVVMEDIVNGVYSYHIVRLRPTTPIDLKFSAYAFKTKHFYKQAFSICEGSGQRYVISQDDFRNMTVFIPTDLAEQKAIAEILSKADEEIELLNKKLEAFKQEKKALMQQLLTGKIRVKVN